MKMLVIRSLNRRLMLWETLDKHRNGDDLGLEDLFAE